MNAAYLSALSALAGSAIGALASFATTWLTQYYQGRSQRFSVENTRRERLFGEFIDKASELYGDALTHSLEGPATLVPLYADLNRLRLFASTPTIDLAVGVMSRIVETYHSPNLEAGAWSKVDPQKFDILVAFTESCRRELTAR